MATCAAWPNRLLWAGRVLFVLGLLCLCFNRPVARALVSILKPPTPLWISGFMHHPLSRYSFYVLCTGFGLILSGGVVGLVGRALRADRRSQHSGSPDPPPGL